METAPLVYTVADFCKTFRLGRTFVYARIADGSLKARRITARKILITKVDAEAWLNASVAA